MVKMTPGVFAVINFVVAVKLNPDGVLLVLSVVSPLLNGMNVKMLLTGQQRDMFGIVRLAIFTSKSLPTSFLL